MLDITVSCLAFSTIGAFLTYLFFLCAYRFFLHPLCSFPGPKISAITFWHEFYHDVVKDGQFIWEIEKMHEKYGPIVRINPDELHIRDAKFYDQLYAPRGASRQLAKFEPWTKTFAAPSSLIAIVEHSVHRERRTPLNPFFSLSAVRKLEPLIKEKVNMLATRLARTLETQNVVRIDAAFMALSMDIICAYCFGFDRGHLSEQDLGQAWKDSVAGSVAAGSLLRAFPWMVKVSDALPLSWMKSIDPGLGMLLQWKTDIGRIIGSVLDGSRAEDKKSADRTIFHTLRDSSLPPAERSLKRLTDEALVFTGAGSETTSHTLTVIMVHLLENPSCLKILQRELDACMPDPSRLVSWQELSQLPYLSGVIQEGLRLSLGVTTRNPRVSSQDRSYDKWSIPAGTPVSQSAPFVLMDPEIFPDTKSFKPERWLGEDRRTLESYQIVFGRGSRACIGINLAYAELFMATAALLRQMEFELAGSSREDVDFVRDHFTSAPADMYKGVHVRVKALRS